jgi:hypothetical protein
LQTVLSAHAVPFVTGVLAQPDAGLQESVVQTLPSLQLSAVPAVQVPPWQVSAPLQTVPSAQGVPFNTGAFWQPKVALQESVVQTLESLQLSGVPAVQVPLWQVSRPSQASLSVHEVPLATFVCAQPVAGTHESVVQTLESLQLRAVPAVHAPPWQVSAPLQRLPSLHAVPFSTAVLLHPKVGLQESVVQTLESLQLSAVPAVQVPL